MTKRILFICHGNICRSPMAEFILKSLVKARGEEDEYYIESAAVSDEEYGNPIYPPARRCLSRHGVWFDPARTARTVTREDYDRFDLLVCMDESNLRWLRRIIGDDPLGKVRLMMSFAGNHRDAGMHQGAGMCRDVADPWYSGDFERTYQDLIEGCRALLDECG